MRTNKFRRDEVKKFSAQDNKMELASTETNNNVI